MHSQDPQIKPPFWLQSSPAPWRPQMVPQNPSNIKILSDLCLEQFEKLSQVISKLNKKYKNHFCFLLHNIIPWEACISLKLKFIKTYINMQRHYKSETELPKSFIQASPWTSTQRPTPREQKERHPVRPGIAGTHGNASDFTTTVLNQVI